MAEENVDAKEPETTCSIKVFISGNSGNKEMVTHQQRILMILNSLKFPVTVIDIASPGMEDETDFMRGNAKKKDGQRHVLPPQIFNGDKYCGEYDDFDLANEDDVLEEFLGIPRKNLKAAPVALDVLPGEAGKPEAGKLPTSADSAGTSDEVPMETDKIANGTQQELEQTAKEE